MRLPPRSRTRSAVLAAVAVVTLLSLVTGCFGQPTKQSSSFTGAALPEIDPAAWEARGSIVSSEPLTDLEGDVTSVAGGAVRAVYRSVSAYDGRGSEVSGTFFVPKGDPPDGGWPVISFAHGTTGLTADCGPSLYPDLKGYASGVASVLKQGFAVAFTDFQGLGHPSAHPYLEPRTEGFNVIDAVRALRNLFPAASTRWMAIGGSQGGQASWAANEYARDYGVGLDLVGAVATAPAADISGFADRARSGTLSDTQIVFMPLVIAGLEVVYPDLDKSDYLRGVAAEQQTTLMSCGDPAAKQPLYSRLTMDQVRPATPEAADRLSEMLDGLKLPQRTLSAPMLVINGSDDDLILPQWVSAAVSRACSMGGVIQHIEVSGQGHVNIDGGGDSHRWMYDRFKGEEAPSTCPPR